MLFEKLFPHKQPVIDHEWRVPELTGHEILPDPNYQLQSSEDEIAARIAQEPSIGNMHAGRYLARVLIRTLSPQLHQNVDEWVKGDDLTPIAYGPHRMTFPFYINEWNRHCDSESRRITLDHFIFIKMNNYIQSGEIGTIYDFYYLL